MGQEKRSEGRNGLHDLGEWLATIFSSVGCCLQLALSVWGAFESFQSPNTSKLCWIMLCNKGLPNSMASKPAFILMVMGLQGDCDSGRSAPGCESGSWLLHIYSGAEAQVQWPAGHTGGQEGKFTQVSTFVVPGSVTHCWP